MTDRPRPPLGRRGSSSTPEHEPTIGRVFWTDSPTRLLGEYLRALCETSREGGRPPVYIEGAADSPIQPGCVPRGAFRESPVAALAIDNPGFHRLYFIRPGPTDDELNRAIADNPDADARVLGGPVEEGLANALAELDEDGLARNPTFVMLNLDTREIPWKTLEALAGRDGFWLEPEGTRARAELWMLLPPQGFNGLASVDQDDSSLDAADESLTRLLGDYEGDDVFQAQQGGYLSEHEAGDEYLNLFRWRLERRLRYERTHVWHVRDLAGMPQYMLVVAAGGIASDRAMANLYADALTEHEGMRNENLRRSHGQLQLPLTCPDGSDDWWHARAYDPGWIEDL